MPSLSDICQRTADCERVPRTDIEPFLLSAMPAERLLARRCLALRHLLESVDTLADAMADAKYTYMEDMQRLLALCSLANDKATIVREGFAAGLAAAARKDDALALEVLQMAAVDDIQRGIKHLSDPARGGVIAGAYDAIAARQDAGYTPSGCRSDSGLIRVGYVVPNLVDDVNAPSQRILNFAKYHDPRRFRMHVYSTEVLCKRENPVYFRQQNAPGTVQRAPKILKAFAERDIPFYAAPVGGNMIESAQAVAHKMRVDGIDVAAYESSLACPIDCLVANWRPARAQVNINIGAPMYVEGIDVTTYFMKQNYEREAEYFAARGKRSLFLHGGIDLELELPPLPSRKAVGIPEGAVVLVSVGNRLGERMSREFCETIAKVLRRNPNGIYLVIGGGSFESQKTYFQGLGVSNRVAFAGPSREVRNVIRLADIYVNEFPEGGAQSVMEAMASRIPAVAMRYSDQHLHCCGAEYVGPEMTIASRDFGGYVSLVEKLIRDVDCRLERGEAAYRRVEELYSFRKCVDRFEALYEELHGQAAAPAA